MSSAGVCPSFPHHDLYAWINLPFSPYLYVCWIVSVLTVSISPAGLLSISPTYIVRLPDLSPVLTRISTSADCSPFSPYIYVLHTPICNVLDCSPMFVLCDQVPVCSGLCSHHINSHAGLISIFTISVRLLDCSPFSPYLCVAEWFRSHLWHLRLLDFSPSGESTCTLES
ncbi:hypothetical protein AVEN_62040-1 [Araneus ventricosus]|uniref:Uncharacterized protein n=1 Tax=Araneus ventricosus TaxID=182803 RepID=A0A4Y2JG72_ARAVE|nr:hypothetical protein AVEN_62040-1 [Araneus ventricosus]